MQSIMKDYLGQAYRENELIHAKENQILYLHDLSEKTTALHFNESGIRNQSNDNKKENIICKIVDLEDELLDDIKNIVDSSEEIMHIIKNVQNPDYRLLLQYRYLNFKTWAEIADEMHFTTQWINVLHHRALQELDKKN